MVDGIQVGALAPDFTRLDHRERSLRLATLVEAGPVVLFFLPRPGSWVCTAEACALGDATAGLDQEGVTLIGVSPQDDASHRTFAARHGLRYGWISDADGSLRQLYAVRPTFRVIPGRVTFVIDPARRIRLRHEGQLRGEAHVRAAMETLARLRAERESAEGADRDA